MTSHYTILSYFIFFSYLLVGWSTAAVSLYRHLHLFTLHYITCRHSGPVGEMCGLKLS